MRVVRTTRSSHDRNIRTSKGYKYLENRSKTREGVDSLDIAIVLGQLELIDDPEIPGIREKFKLHQWIRLSTILQKTIDRLRQDYLGQSGGSPELGELTQAVATLLENLVHYCQTLSVEQRRAKGRKNTQRYRERKRAV